MIRDVRAAYERFEFYRVYQRIYQFCSVELSSFYLDVLKDRLYAEAPDGPDRRAAQFVLARLHDDLTRLLAPIIPHTAEELWDFLPAAGRQARRASTWPSGPSPTRPGTTPAATPRWTDLLAVRDEILRALEKLRAAKVIGSAQEASVHIGSNDPGIAALLERAPRPADDALAIVSEVEIGGDHARRRRPRARPDRALGQGRASRPTPSASGAGTSARPSARTPSTRRSATAACGSSIALGAGTGS